MPMHYRHAVVTLLACAALAAPALSHAAAEPRYTYGEVGYLTVDFDNFDTDGDGWAVNGSYALHKNVHLLAEYNDLDFDGPGDLTSLALGAGVNLPLRKGLDFIGRLRWIDQEVDIGNSNDDETGYGLEVGIRTMINPQLELDSSIRYVDIDDDNTSFVLGGLWEFTPVFALGGDVELSDDYNAFFLKARFYFTPPAQVR